MAIAVRAARRRANVALLAKTDQPDPRLPGSIHTAAEEIGAAGGKTLPVVGDVRHDYAVYAAVERTVATFGGIDIVVNNASAIDLSGSEALSMKRYDLMQNINCRGGSRYLLHVDGNLVALIDTGLNHDGQPDHAAAADLLDYMSQPASCSPSTM